MMRRSLNCARPRLSEIDRGEIGRREIGRGEIGRGSWRHFRERLKAVLRGVSVAGCR